eukprot:TRINITY_DN32651_c0_g1_i1.p1 TRINITY_DN32651_c0_g1~~TRINITY_DN32651_c0_g1_i1.p1  ORF type:complete len:486 (-),score=22.41 TRINITY_DN32651_c0_g1_i1:144-1544(-)
MAQGLPTVPENKGMSRCRPQPLDSPTGIENMSLGVTPLDAGGSAILSTVRSRSSNFSFVSQLSDSSCKTSKIRLVRELSKRSILSDEFAEKLSRQNPSAHQTITDTPLGLGLQALIVILTTAAYTAVPIFVGWSKLVRTITDGELVRWPNSYSDSSVVVLYNASTVFSVLSAYGFVLWRADEPLTKIMHMFHWQLGLNWGPIGLLYLGADLSELLAASNIDATMYQALSQGRILGAAVLGHFYLHKHQSGLQWAIIFTITLSVISWVIMPGGGCEEGGVSESNIIGIAGAMGKVVLSVVTSAMLQRKYQSHTGPSDHFLLQWACMRFYAMVFSVVSAIIITFATGWGHGVFGGEPHEGNSTGFDARTGVVVVVFLFREVMNNICLKSLSAIVKELCVATALVSSYVLDVAVIRSMSFATHQATLSVVILLVVTQYSLSKNYVLKQSASSDGVAPQLGAAKPEVVSI